MLQSIFLSYDKKTCFLFLSATSFFSAMDQKDIEIQMKNEADIQVRIKWSLENRNNPNFFFFSKNHLKIIWRPTFENVLVSKISSTQNEEKVEFNTESWIFPQIPKCSKYFWKLILFLPKSQLFRTKDKIFFFQYLRHKWADL